jgi:hypothetical protein
VRRAVVIVLLVMACQGEPKTGATADASPPPDAAPVLSCDRTDDVTLELGSYLGYGGVDDMWSLGPGAWFSQRSAQKPPGDILYLEAFADLIEGDEVRVAEYQGWHRHCTACLILARECTSYGLVYSGQNPNPPLSCGHMYSLDRGVVSFTRLEAGSYDGAIEGTIAPLDGDPAVRLVEIAQDSEHFGDRIAGDCVAIAPQSFSAAWSL